MPWVEGTPCASYLPPSTSTETKGAQWTKAVRSSGLNTESFSRDDAKKIFKELLNNNVDAENKLKALSECLFDHDEIARLMVKRYDDQKIATVFDLADKVTRSPIISGYNFKGGVGKTTTVQNLAGALAAQQYRIGIIDADPQGNCTEVLTRDEKSVSRVEEEVTTLALYETESDDLRVGDYSVPPKALDSVKNKFQLSKEILREEDIAAITSKSIPMLHNTLDLIHEKSMASLIDLEESKKDIFQMHKRVYQPNVRGQCGGEIYLLAGAPQLQDIANKIEGWIKSSLFAGSFRQLCHQLAKKFNLDAIFVDLGPSQSVFNEWIIASSDFVLPPTSPTSFGYQSAKDLHESVMPNIWAKQRNWVKESWKGIFTHAGSSSRKQEQMDAFFNPLTRMLPFVISMFRKNNQAEKDSNTLFTLDSHFVRKIDTMYTALNRPLPWYEDTDIAYEFGVENTDEIISDGERAGIPVPLLNQGAASKQLKSQWKHKHARVRYCYATLAKSLVKSCAIQRSPKRSLEDSELETLVNLICNTAKAQVEAKTTDLSQSIVTELRKSLPLACIFEVNKSHIMVYTHGPYDRRPVLIKVATSKSSIPRLQETLSKLKTEAEVYCGFLHETFGDIKIPKEVYQRNCPVIGMTLLDNHLKMALFKATYSPSEVSGGGMFSMEPRNIPNQEKFKEKLPDFDFKSDTESYAKGVWPEPPKSPPKCSSETIKSEPDFSYSSVSPTKEQLPNNYEQSSKKHSKHSPKSEKAKRKAMSSSRKSSTSSTSSKKSSSLPKKSSKNHSSSSQNKSSSSQSKSSSSQSKSSSSTSSKKRKAVHDSSVSRKKKDTSLE